MIFQGTLETKFMGLRARKLLGRGGVSLSPSLKLRNSITNRKAVPSLFTQSDSNPLVW